MVRAGNPAHVAGLADLARTGLALAMPNPTFEGVARQIRATLVKAAKAVSPVMKSSPARAASGCGASLTIVTLYSARVFCASGISTWPIGLPISSWNRASDFQVTPASTRPRIRNSGVWRWWICVSTASPSRTLRP
jgi:hypothetical protein